MTVPERAGGFRGAVTGRFLGCLARLFGLPELYGGADSRTIPEKR